MLNVILVFLGAGLGGVLRFAITGWADALLKSSTFPIGTLVVNTSGCLAVGIVAALTVGSPPMRDEHRALIMVGLLGGFTTFSAFGRESVALMEGGQWMLAGINILLSNALGLGAAWVGLRFTSALLAD